VTEPYKKREIIDSIARFYEKKCEEKIHKDLEALYLFGSYAFGKISLDIPDINYLLLLKEGVPPEIFLKNAEILREVCNEFKDVATVMPEFRPNRYVYPTLKGADFDVTLCTQYARMEDRYGPVPFGWGWVLEALLQTRKMIFGRDALAEVHQPPPTRDYIKTFFPPTFSHIWLPLERAPFQYRLPEESYLLMHEAHKVAQMASIGFGVTLALNEKELEEKKWIEFVTDKNKLVQFYQERYDEASARNVELMLEVRDNWLKHKNDPEMAIKMYKAAVEICTRIKAKYGEFVRG
jgi:predicted nucleotidyltransferase